MNQRNPIKIVPYNPDWPKLFEHEKQLLRAALPAVILQVHHIGSTSVKGLAAKPIIDILLVVSRLHKLDASALVFARLGYECLGEFGIKGRRYFRKNPQNETHHIHAYAENDANILRHIAFRDYLESHLEIQKEYVKLKYDLAASFENNRDAYAAGKNDFIKFHEKRALRWIATAQNHRRRQGA